MNMAIVIDADNASHDSLNEIIKEVEKHGRITIKRAYGDFMKNCCLNPWLEKLKKHGFEVRQNFNHSSGKNSTDIAMVIDSMDIMHNYPVQGFCIVSSDSDFTHLAMRIKSQGMFCLGIGRFNTLHAFKDACDKFTHIENLKIAPPQTTYSEVIKTEVPKLPGLKVLGSIKLGN